MAGCLAQAARKGHWLYTSLARFHQQRFLEIKHPARLTPPHAPSPDLSASHKAPPQHTLPHLHSPWHTSLVTFRHTSIHFTSTWYISPHVSIPHITSAHLSTPTSPHLLITRHGLSHHLPRKMVSSLSRRCGHLYSRQNLHLTSSDVSSTLLG